MAWTIYGPALSTYVRSVRLALEEKGVAYELVPVDILQGEHKAEGHRRHHPFGVVPAVEHDGFELYETSAILRYVDRVEPAPALTPSDPREAARMDQIIAVIDAYAYPAMISKMVIQRVVMPMVGGTTDEQVIAEAMPRVALCFEELERLMGGRAFLAGSGLSLADLLLAPIMAYVSKTPDAQPLLAARPGLQRWWAAMEQRPTMQRTAPQPS